jgi:hypothetical protein
VKATRVGLITLKILGRIALGVVLSIVLLASILVVPNWYAERSARQFCEDIAVGSNISAAVAKANARKILWGDYRGYTFYFPGFGFDKAVCEASVDADGKVTAKGSLMEYD